MVRAGRKSVVFRVSVCVVVQVWVEGSTTVDGEWVSSVGEMGECPADLGAPASGPLSGASALTAVVSIVMVGLHDGE